MSKSKRPVVCYVRNAGNVRQATHTRCGAEVDSVLTRQTARPVPEDMSGFWGSVTCKKCIAKRRELSSDAMEK